MTEATENQVLPIVLSFNIPHKDHLIVYSKHLILQFIVVFIVLFCYNRELTLGSILQKMF